MSSGYGNQAYVGPKGVFEQKEIDAWLAQSQNKELYHTGGVLDINKVVGICNKVTMKKCVSLTWGFSNAKISVTQKINS